MAYGFFPSFFSVDASSDPYWQDHNKIENGRPFFRKYIPIIKQIAAAGWQPVTLATSNSGSIRIERFGEDDRLFFTVRNYGDQDLSCVVMLDVNKLKIQGKFSAVELVNGQVVRVEENRIMLTVPAGRTQVVRIQYD